MTTIVTRSGKGSPLTHTEVDTNFTNLNTAKLEAGAIALGSAATPSISFTGDTNTGIYSPGADQVAVATNGTGRLFVDASGRIIIGAATAAIGNPLEIVGNATGLAVGVRGRSADNVGIIGFYPNNSGTEYTRIQSNGDSSLSFGTGSSGSERARIRADGTFEIKGAGTAGISPGFSVNPSTPANSFVIDSSGRLLIGTSTALSAGALAQYARTQIVSNTSGSESGGLLALVRSEAATAITTNELIGGVTFSDNTGNTFAQVIAEADANAGASDFPGRLVFSTNPGSPATGPTERMRITNDGNVLIGTTNTATGARIYCTTGNNASSVYAECTNASQTVSVLSLVASRNTTDGSFKALEYYNSGAGATRFFVSDNGDARNTNGVFGAISDIKLKENIVDANSQWNDIKALRVRNYNLKSDQTHRQIGVVAQELELVSPGLVADLPDYDRDGNDLGTVTKSVNYSVLYMKAVKALQEAMERIEQLETEMAAVKAQLS